MTEATIGEKSEPGINVSHIHRDELNASARSYADNLSSQLQQKFAGYGVTNYSDFRQHVVKGVISKDDVVAITNLAQRLEKITQTGEGPIFCAEGEITDKEYLRSSDEEPLMDVNVMKFSPDGKILAVGGKKQVTTNSSAEVLPLVVLLHLNEAGEIVKKERLCTDIPPSALSDVQYIDFNPSGDTLLVGSSKTDWVFLYALGTEGNAEHLNEDLGPQLSRGSIFSPDGKGIIKGGIARNSDTSDTSVIELHTGTEVIPLYDAPQNTIVSFTVDPKGKYLTIGLIRGKFTVISLKETENGKPKVIVPPTPIQQPIEVMTYDQDGKLLAIGTTRMYADIQIFDMEQRNTEGVPAKIATVFPDESIQILAFPSVKDRIMITTPYGKTAFYSLTDKDEDGISKELAYYQSDYVGTAILSPTGELLAVAENVNAEGDEAYDKKCVIKILGKR